MKSIDQAKFTRFFALILCLAMLFTHSLPFFAQNEADAPSEEDILNVARGVIQYEKSLGNCRADYLIDGDIVSGAGTSSSDWLAFAIGRFGADDNYAGYLAVAEDYIAARYKEEGKLSAYKATEWHRLILSVLSCGGNPFEISGDGEKINLVADGIYNRDSASPLDKQGLNGLIWALIALDSRRYNAPENASYTRESIIEKILGEQSESGDFRSVGSNSDVDITAMALTALAPYYYDDTVYRYIQKSTGETVSSTVGEAIDSALACLSEMQTENGDFTSFGTPTLESTCQVTVALCSLGIDPFSDGRFIKNGNSVWDAMLRYRTENGGFSHKAGGGTDKLASMQALYTLAAIWRYKSGMRALFDLCDEMSADMQKRISDIELRVSKADSLSLAEVNSALSDYFSLPGDTRRYVRNQKLLFEAAEAKNADIAGIKSATAEIPDFSAIPTAKSFDFADSDMKKADSLPDILTTEYYISVTTLLYKLNASGDSDGINIYREKLEKAKADILEIKNKIAELNRDISLLPAPSALSRDDRQAIESIAERYNALDDYDKQFVSDYDSVEILLIHINTARRTVFLTISLIICAAVVSSLLTLRIKRRISKKAREMDELASMYESEDDE